MNVILAIAALCQMSISPINGEFGTNAWMTSDEEQLRCQQYYIKCYEASQGSPYEAVKLSTCIKDRRP